MLEGELLSEGGVYILEKTQGCLWRLHAYGADNHRYGGYHLAGQP